MRKPVPRWITFLYGPLFKVIGFFYRSYTANRARLANLKSNQTVAGLVRYVAIAILLGWILIWYFAAPEERSGLVDEVRQSIGVSGSPKK